MAALDAIGAQLRRRIPAWVYACTYALVVGILLACGALLITLVTGGDLVRAKILLFLGGWVLLAIATARLWPRRGSEDASTGSYDEAVERVEPDGRIQRITNAVPPARWVRRPPPPERISTAGKQFLGGVVTLAFSLLLETAFGVG